MVSPVPIPLVAWSLPERFGRKKGRRLAVDGPDQDLCHLSLSEAGAA